MDKIAKRQQKQKEELVEELKKVPIIEICCKKCNIARSTYYRWIKDDPEFALCAEIAIEEGANIVSDLAESQLINLIKEGNAQSIFYWLNHRHPKFINKLEVSTRNNESFSLTPEQEELIQKALQIAAPPQKEDEEKDGNR